MPSYRRQRVALAFGQGAQFVDVDPAAFVMGVDGAAERRTTVAT